MSNPNISEFPTPLNQQRFQIEKKIDSMTNLEKFLMMSTSVMLQVLEIPKFTLFSNINVFFLVPLHVLHSYGKQGSSDDEPSRLPFARPVAKRNVIKEIPKLPIREPIRGRGRGRVANTVNLVPRVPAIIIPKK